MKLWTAGQQALPSMVQIVELSQATMIKSFTSRFKARINSLQKKSKQTSEIVNIKPKLHLGKFCALVYSKIFDYFVAYDDWNRELVMINLKNEEKPVSKIADLNVGNYALNRFVTINKEGKNKNKFDKGTRIFVLEDWIKLHTFNLTESGINQEEIKHKTTLINYNYGEFISDYKILENGNILTLTRNGHLRLHCGPDSDTGEPGEILASAEVEREDPVEHTCFSLAIDESDEIELNIVIMNEKQMRRESLLWFKLTVDSFMGNINFNLEASLNIRSKSYGCFFRAMRFLRGDNGKNFLVGVQFERNPKDVFFYVLEEGEGIVQLGHGIEGNYHEGDWVYQFETWNGDKFYSIDESGEMSVLAICD